MEDEHLVERNVDDGSPKDKKEARTRLSQQNKNTRESLNS